MKKDLPTAAQLFEPACKGGLDMACAFFGMMLAKGEGVAKDETRARDVFEQGCTDSFPGGCYLFGTACRAGLLGDEYTPRADALLTRACQHGVGEACNLLAKGAEGAQP